MEQRNGRTITYDANEFTDVIAPSATAEPSVTAETSLAAEASLGVSPPPGSIATSARVASRGHPPSSLAIRVDSEHQPRRQRLAIQGGAVYAPDWHERIDRCGAHGRDTGSLQLTGDLVTQRLGDIQISVVHDASRPEE